MATPLAIFPSSQPQILYCVPVREWFSPDLKPSGKKKKWQYRTIKEEKSKRKKSIGLGVSDVDSRVGRALPQANLVTLLVRLL